MRVFKVNIDKLNLLLLPTFLRNNRVYAFCKAFSVVEKTIYSRFLQKRSETLRLLEYDSGKLNIEILLRKTFGEGIYIELKTNDNAVYLSDVEVVYLSDVDAVYLSGVGYQPAVETMYLDSYLSCYLDAVQRDYQYTIYVPSHIYTLYNAEIDRYARLYTLPGVNYLIQSYNI